jgi:hypothetical protein
VPYLGVCHASRPPQSRCLLETWIWYSFPGAFRSELLCLLFMDVSVVWALSQCCRMLRMVSYVDCSVCWNKCYFRTGYDRHIQNRLRIPHCRIAPELNVWSLQNIRLLQVCSTCAQRRVGAPDPEQPDPLAYHPHVAGFDQNSISWSVQDRNEQSQPSPRSPSPSRSRTPPFALQDQPGRWWSPVSDSS